MGTVQQDYITLRPIVMTFRTSTYAQARQIVDRLCSSENISQISDMNMNTYTEGPQQRHRGDYAGHHLLRDHALRMPGRGAFL